LRRRRAAAFAAVAIAAFAVGLLVAILGGQPATRQPNSGEWLVQVGLLSAVALLLVVRMRRKG